MICRRSGRRGRIAGLLLVWLAGVSATSAADPIGDAVRALAVHDGMAAELAAARALRSGSRPADVSAIMGEALLVQGRMADARRWLGPMEFSAGTRQRGFHALGRLNLAEGHMADAARAFDRALASGPATPRLWVDIGGMRYRSGQQHLALDAARRALALDGADPLALRFRAQLARDSQGLIAALPWFERAMAKTPDDVDLLGDYAATLGDAGRNRAMLLVARRMVAIDPRDPRAYYLQAVLAARAGSFALARRLLWKTGNAYAESPAGLLLDGLIELAEGNPALAVDRFDALTRLQPQNRTARILLARALLANGEANEVIARLPLNPMGRHATPYLLALVARAHEMAGNRKTAAALLDRAAAMPDRSLAVLPLDSAGDLALWRANRSAGSEPVVAVAQLRRMAEQGHPAQAWAMAQALVKRFPGSADIERLAGDSALLANHPEQALAGYRQAGQVRMDHALLLRTAVAEDMVGRDARPGLRAFVAQNPRSLVGWRALGQAQFRARNWPAAAQSLQVAGAIGGWSDPALLTLLADALVRSGQPTQALEPARRALVLQPARPAAAGTLLRVLEATGIDRPGQRALAARVSAG